MNAQRLREHFGDQRVLYLLRPYNCSSPTFCFYLAAYTEGVTTVIVPNQRYTISEPPDLSGLEALRASQGDLEVAETLTSMRSGSTPVN